MQTFDRVFAEVFGPAGTTNGAAAGAAAPAPVRA
jgi:hypothetical protein